MPKKTKNSKKTLIFLSLFIITIVVTSMFLFRPAETPKSVYEITVGEGNEKATVRLNFQSAYVMSLTGYVAEWQDASGNTISKITWSVTVTLTDVSNMQYDSGQTSYVKIKVTGSGKSKIYQINLSWQTSTKATGSLTKNIDTFLSEIGVTIDEGESVTFNNYLYEAKIYLKGTISGNGYVASIGEQSSSFGSFTIKKPITAPTLSDIRYYYKYGSSWSYSSWGSALDKLTDNSITTYIWAKGGEGDIGSQTIYIELTFYGSGNWQNVRFHLEVYAYVKKGDGTIDGSYFPISLKYYVGGSIATTYSWSYPDLGWRDYYTDYLNLQNDIDSNGYIYTKIYYTVSANFKQLNLGVSEAHIEYQTASFIEFFARTDIQVALIVAVILMIAIFVKRREVKRYARRH